MYISCDIFLVGVDHWHYSDYDLWLLYLIMLIFLDLFHMIEPDCIRVLRWFTTTDGGYTVDKSWLSVETHPPGPWWMFCSCHSWWMFHIYVFLIIDKLLASWGFLTTKWGVFQQFIHTISANINLIGIWTSMDWLTFKRTWTLKCPKFRIMIG